MASCSLFPTLYLTLWTCIIIPGTYVALKVCGFISLTHCSEGLTMLLPPMLRWLFVFPAVFHQLHTILSTHDRLLEPAGEV